MRTTLAFNGLILEVKFEGDFFSKCANTLLYSLKENQILDVVTRSFHKLFLKLKSYKNCKNDPRKQLSSELLTVRQHSLNSSC